MKPQVIVEIFQQLMKYNIVFKYNYQHIHLEQ